MKKGKLRNIAYLIGRGERPYVFMLLLLSIVLIPVVIIAVFKLGGV